jgi:hypothetical protein
MPRGRPRPWYGHDSGESGVGRHPLWNSAAMAVTPWSVRVFTAGAVGVAVGLTLLSLDVSAGSTLTEMSLLAATPSAAVITLGREAAPGKVRRLAGAFLWLVFFSPFVLVGCLLAMGADPLSTFLAAVLASSGLLILAVVVAITLTVHATLLRHARKAAD